MNFHRKQAFVLIAFLSLLFFSCQRDDQQSSRQGERPESPPDNQEASQRSQRGGGARGGAVGAPGEDEEERFAVVVTPVIAGEVVDYMDLSGDIRVFSNVSAVSEVSGEVVRVFVEVGDTVRRDAALIEVDPSRPGQRFETNIVRAPISGTVVSIASKRGSTVNAGMPVVQVSSVSDLEIVTQVAERFVSKVEKGQEALVTLDAYEGREYEASVSEVSPLLDPLSRALEIKLTLKERYPEVKPGMFASIRLITERKQERVKIPSECIIQRFEKDIVYTVTDEDTVVERTVIVGLNIDGVAEIIDGLLPGEFVVYQGQSLLEDGTNIQVVETIDVLDS